MQQIAVASGLPKRQIALDAMAILQTHDWPGNIRQLENVIQQAVLTSSGNELKLHHLSPLVHSRSDVTTPPPGATANYGGTLKQSRESTERVNILRALEKAGQTALAAEQRRLAAADLKVRAR